MIVITGASSGLGAQLAKLYDAQGEETLLTGRSEEKLATLAQHLSNKAQTRSCDLVDTSQVENLFDELPKAPSTLIHCAGSGYFGLLAEQDPQEIQKLIENNLTSAINILRELVKRYQDQPVNVVMVMSTAAQQAKGQESTYCAVKSEALYVADAPGFTLSVQWHPEWRAGEDPVSRPLFEAFGAAARAFRAERRA